MQENMRDNLKQQSKYQQFLFYLYEIFSLFHSHSIVADLQSLIDKGLQARK